MVKFNIDSILNLVIGVVLVFSAIRLAMPTAQAEGDNLAENASTLPFATFFSGTGILFLAIMGSIVVLVVRVVRGKK